jgi:predicted HicB family RNase H-like nuclease
MHRDAAVYAAPQNISLNDFVKTAIDFALVNKEGINKFLHR